MSLSFWILTFSSVVVLALLVVLIFQRRFYRKLMEELRRSEAQSEEELWDLEETRRHFQAVFRGMREAILLIRKDGEILLVNPAFEKYFGISAQEAKGRNLLEILRNKDLNEALRCCVDTKQEQTSLIEIPGPVPRYFEVRAVYLEQAGGNTGALAVLHDVTALQKAETMRRDFVANVSHELKTPLGAITGYAETLLDGAMNDKKECEDFLGIIRSNSLRLKELIVDLLDLAKIESQELPLHRERIVLKELAESVLPLFRGRLSSKNIAASVDMDPRLNVRGDSQRIKQVFINLLDNAIKFNRPGGKVRIAAAVANGSVEVSVQDTGTGIPAEDLPRVFERFYRVEKDRSRSPESGTGLGLAIVKHIVEQHGGKVWAESQVGQGSTFRFTLPTA